MLSHTRYCVENDECVYVFVFGFLCCFFVVIFVAVRISTEQKGRKLERILSLAEQLSSDVGIGAHDTNTNMLARAHQYVKNNIIGWSAVCAAYEQNCVHNVLCDVWGYSWALILRNIVAKILRAVSFCRLYVIWDFFPLLLSFNANITKFYIYFLSVYFIFVVFLSSCCCCCCCCDCCLFSHSVSSIRFFMSIQ